MKRIKKTGLTILKVLFSGLLIYFIYTKIDFKELLQTLTHIQPLYFIVATALFILSKYISALRLHAYFKTLSIPITQLANLKLYLLGMFYNLFLPSGIGGDAYKGYLIKTTFDVSTKRVAASLVVDRLSGLVMLTVLALFMTIWIQLPLPSWLTQLLPFAIPLAILTFWLIHKFYFQYLLGIFWKSIFLSTLVQLSQLVSVYFILQALSIDSDGIIYLFIFLVSSIVSVLPLTIGGIGAREVTFFYGSTWLSIEEHLAISVSMIFFFITALVSLMGIVYHIKKPSIRSKSN